MAEIEELRALCLDDNGRVKDKTDCRAAIINHLILEELLDVDEAEDKTDEALRRMDLWPKEEEAPDMPPEEQDESVADDNPQTAVDEEPPIA
jgi:hypothetical protein